MLGGAVTVTAGPMLTARADASARPASAGHLTPLARPVTIELFVTESSTEVPAPPSDWFWYKAVKQALNIDVKITWGTEGSQYTPTLQTRAAANNLPDLFRPDLLTLSQLVNQGLVADWTPYLKYMPHFVRDHDVKELAPVGTFDGKMYGLTIKNPFPYKTVTVIRKDWLNKLGLKVPKTLDEYLKVMKAFTEKDPDGNGKADTYGYSAYVGTDNSLGGFDPILGAFDALGTWRVQNGKLVPLATSTQMEDALKFINKMSQAGVLDPDWTAQKAEDFTLKWKSGKVGIFSFDWCGTFCPENYNIGFGKANPKGVLEIIDPPVGPHGQRSAGTYSNVGGIWAMSQGAANAGKGKAIATLLEWMDGPGYVLTVFGQEGKNKGYTRDAKGHIVPNTQQPYERELQLHSYAIKGSTEEWKLRYGGTTKQGDGSVLNIYNDVLLRAQKPPKTDMTRFAPLPPPPADVAADLTRTQSEAEFNLAAGRMPFSKWNAYVQSLKSAGLDEWVKEATKRARQLGIIK
jgi:putative aldouronate transport system substrate-binding protein